MGNKWGPTKYGAPKKIVNFSVNMGMANGPSKMAAFRSEQNNLQSWDNIGPYPGQTHYIPGMRGYKQVVGHITVAPDLEDDSS